MSLTEESKVIKLSRALIKSDGKIDTKILNDIDLPFEMFFTLGKIKSEILVKRAEKLLVKNHLPLTLSQ